MPGVDGLYELCLEYLAACQQAVAFTPGGEIERVFITPGPPAWDTPSQLTVHAGGPQIADTAPLQPPLQPGHRIGGTGTVNLVTMTATVLRPCPVLEEDDGWVTPDADDIEAAARVTLADVWTIWQHVKSLRVDGTLWPKPREVFLDAALPLQTTGGIAGWQIPVRVQLDGFSTT